MHERAPAQRARPRPDREVAACDRFDGIGVKRSAPQTVSNVDLRLGKHVHRRDSDKCDEQSGNRKLSPLAVPETPKCAADDVEREREQKNAGDLACAFFGRFRNSRPCFISTVRRHIKTPADASSMTLSIPKATSVKLCETIPDPTATMASTVIHATVIHSSVNARRISAVRDSCEAVEAIKRTV